MSGPARPETYDKVSAPRTYVAGLGRGAVGFLTRSDIGPAVAAAPEPEYGKTGPRGYVAGAGRGATSLPGSGYVPKEGDFWENKNQQGGSESLFASGQYNAEDAEADRVYEQVDERMDGRRKRKREQIEREQLENFRNSTPRIVDTFRPYKKALHSVTQQEWADIPEVGDRSLKLKYKRKEQMTAIPAPDHIIAMGVDSDQRSGSISANPGYQSVQPGMVTDLRTLKQTKDAMLSNKLDTYTNSVTSGSQSVNPDTYMGTMSSMEVLTDADVGDLKKARQVLTAVIKSNPSSGPGWISFARLEERAGQLAAARKIIREACTKCPKSEDVFIEASRLLAKHNANVIIKNGLVHNPKSVKLWLCAVKLEPNDDKKRAIFRQALEKVPESVKLWKEAMQLEDEESTKTMMSCAVEFIPDAIDLWIALAKLEDYENAMRVLRNAVKKNPKSRPLWLATAQLQEACGNLDKMIKVIEKALQRCREENPVLERPKWLEDALKSELADSPETGCAIIQATMDLGVEPEDRELAWPDDASNLAKRGGIRVARCLYENLIKTFGKEVKMWNYLVEFEREYGTKERLIEVLERATKPIHCPRCDRFWLMCAKEKWLLGDVSGARTILANAHTMLPSSEEVWLAMAKLEWENGEIERTRVLLGLARKKCPKPRIWMKAIMLEWEEGNLQSASEILNEALKKPEYQSFAKLWMIRGQIDQQLANESMDDMKKNKYLDEAKKNFQLGIKFCRKCPTLWILASKLEQSIGQTGRARSLLDMARVEIKKCPELWLATVELEQSLGENRMADKKKNQALIDCPKCGELLALDVAMVPRNQQKKHIQEALTKVPDSAYVMVRFLVLFYDVFIFTVREKFSKVCSDYSEVLVLFFFGSIFFLD
eukprot:TRINITY_DN6099_c0_g1_i1.p1 TRINITY_DN6099_c0_g1~~TRINITY_DN6099_c0_g1_i1.p1  ORF type:complete len:885 (+),score=283.35 TRINITY_DN6099_c0_g1_i1:139-2793(+)